jgi:hypothetical protein
MKDIVITPKESQMILEVLSLAAGSMQDFRVQAKPWINNAWHNSDKETEEGRNWFKLLNKGKDRIRHSKDYEKRVNALIRKIRKEL